MRIAVTSWILSLLVLSVAPSVITPKRSPCPSPQNGDIHPGAYRFVNLENGQALAAFDNYEDAWLVTKPIANDDNTQRWHVIDPTNERGLSFLNNGTGKFFTASGLWQPVKMKRVIPEYWEAVWYTESGHFEEVPDALYFYVQNPYMEGTIQSYDDYEGGFVIYLSPIVITNVRSPRGASRIKSTALTALIVSMDAAGYPGNNQLVVPSMV
ncbi:hypothetical protein XPA_000655 [Xanthoria parietina]